MGRLRSLLVAVAIIATLAAVGKTAFGFTTWPIYSVGPNAMWLGHKWVGEAHSAAAEGTSSELLLCRKLKNLHGNPARRQGVGLMGPPCSS